MKNLIFVFLILIGCSTTDPGPTYISIVGNWSLQGPDISAQIQISEFNGVEVIDDTGTFIIEGVTYNHSKKSEVKYISPGVIGAVSLITIDYANGIALYEGSIRSDYKAIEFSRYSVIIEHLQYDYDKKITLLRE